MIADWLNQESDQAAARYDNLMASWRVLFHGAVSSPKFQAADLPTSVVRQAYDVAEVYLTGEKQIIADRFDATALAAHRSTVSAFASADASELSPSSLTHLSATQSYLLDELVAQIHRDVAALRMGLQQGQLQVSVLSRANGITWQQAQVQYRLKQEPAIEFMFTDRAGRQWTTKRFVRTVWRQALLSVYNEIVLFDLADHGFSSAAVLSDKGQVTSISLTGEGTGYADIRDQVFHPNSNAWIAQESAHVSA